MREICFIFFVRDKCFGLLIFVGALSSEACVSVGDELEIIDISIEWGSEWRNNGPKLPQLPRHHLISAINLEIWHHKSPFTNPSFPQPLGECFKNQLKFLRNSSCTHMCVVHFTRLKWKLILLSRTIGAGPIPLRAWVTCRKWCMRRWKVSPCLVTSPCVLTATSSIFFSL
jgi:hypothetical protein